MDSYTTHPHAECYHTDMNRRFGRLVRHLVLFLLLCVCGGSHTAHAQGNGAKILESTVKKITDAPSFSTRFTLLQGKEKTEGDMLMAGKMFVISAANGNFRTWFDGKTQWTWSSTTNEVNMTEPDRQELAETNPLIIMQDAISGYDISVESKNSATTTLLLKPKQSGKNNIRRTLVIIKNDTGFPESLKITLDDGQVVTVTLTDTRTGKSVPRETFRYNPSFYPNAEIIDLR